MIHMNSIERCHIWSAKRWLCAEIPHICFIYFIYYYSRMHECSRVAVHYAATVWGLTFSAFNRIWNTEYKKKIKTGEGTSRSKISQCFELYMHNLQFTSIAFVAICTKTRRHTIKVYTYPYILHAVGWASHANARIVVIHNVFVLSVVGLQSHDCDITTRRRAQLLNRNFCIAIWDCKRVDTVQL